MNKDNVSAQIWGEIKWTVVAVNPNNPDERMEFESIEKMNAKLFELKEEVDRLRSGSFITAVPSSKYEEMLKAGDAMADFLGPCSAVRKWNKAKDSQ
jgi:hypothetical protein